MDKQLTEAQIKEFWEWCGFKCVEDKEAVLGRKWTSPEGYTCFANIRGAYTCPPELDINNLFKYAVPKLQDLGEISFCYVAKGWRVFIVIKTPHIKSCHSEDIYNDPALALFWAIWEVIHD